jgi:hypothetical protein
MLRRDFLSLIASFTAASAAVKVAAAAANVPADRAVCGVDLAAPSGDVTVVALVEALEHRSQFERTLVECLRDGSLYCLGVTSDAGADYRVMYVPSDGSLAASRLARAAAVLSMYDRGIIFIDRVNAYNGFDGVEVFFSICTKG